MTSQDGFTENAFRENVSKEHAYETKYNTNPIGSASRPADAAGVNDTKSKSGLEGNIAPLETNKGKETGEGEHKGLVEKIKEKIKS